MLGWMLFLGCQGTEPVAAEPVPEAPLARGTEMQWRPADPFQARSDTRLGCRNLLISQVDREAEAACLEDEGLGWVPPPHHAVWLESTTWQQSARFALMPALQSKFVVDPGPDRLVAITVGVNGEVNEQGDGSPVDLRVRLDGQPLPGPVVPFWEQTSQPARTAPRVFTFFATVPAGHHVVDVQRRSPGTYVFHHDQSLRVDVQQDDGSGPSGDAFRTEASETPGRTFSPIPGATLNFETGAGDELFLVFSPVLEVEEPTLEELETPGFVRPRLRIRAVVDGGTASVEPAEHAFEADGELAPHAVMTAVSGLAAGAHTVSWEWAGDGQPVELAALSMLAYAAPPVAKETALRALVQDADMVLTHEDNVGPVDTGTDTGGPWTSIDPWRLVPGLSTQLDLPEPTEAALTFTLDIDGDRDVWAAPMVDGEARADEEVLIHRGGDVAGARTYAVSVKDLPAGPVDLALAVRSDGTVLESGATTATAGVLGVQAKVRVGPDLGQGPVMGVTSGVTNARIEPVAGDTPVLVVLFDAERDDIPSAVGFESEVEEAVWGPDPSFANYVDVVSGGMASISQPHPVWRVTGSAPGGGLGAGGNVYWDDAVQSCAAGAPFRSAVSARLALALEGVDDDVDFTQFDLDGDEVLSRHELLVVVVSPHSSDLGNKFVTDFDPYCDEEGEPVLPVFDEVLVRGVAKVNQPVFDGDLLQRLGLAGAIAHELGHGWLGLDDLSRTRVGTFAPRTGTWTPAGSGELRRVDTDPYYLSLMSLGSDRLSHLDALHKLHLGWVAPRIPECDGPMHQPLAAQADAVTVLPRLGTDAREYFLLEARTSAGILTDPAYDLFIGASGLAVYHAIEPSPGCFEAGAPDCPSNLAPPCVPADVWAPTVEDNMTRRGLRLVQPDLTHGVDGDGNPELLTLFNEVVEGEVLDDGPVCPTPEQIGESGGRGTLIWSDLSASGYQLLDVNQVVGSGVDLEVTLPAP